jgi:hypothetical protein
MEYFKKDIFLNRYNTAIEFENVNIEEREILQKYVDESLGEDADENTFFINIQQHLKNYRPFDSLDNDQNIATTLESLRLLTEDNVIVIWKYPHDIDKFKLSYLIKYWEDIWFVPSDEAVCLFFPKAFKMILITHWDVVYF